MTTESSGAHAAEPTTGATYVQPTHSHDEPAHAVRHEPVPVPVPAGTQRQDLVSWSAVWAGLIVTLALFLLLEFIFFALGWLTFSQGSPGSSAGIMTAVLALVAFFLGGVTAGATSVWRDGKGGLLHGILVWALGIIGMLFLTLFGGGALFGSVADVLTQATQIRQAVEVPEVQMDEALGVARDSATWAVLGLVLPLVTAALGGLIGGKMGSRASDDGRDALR